MRNTPIAKAIFATDEARRYSEVGTEFASHEIVAHSMDEYVRGDAHTNTVENYFSILKRGIYGCYFHVSEAHLHRYLAEFDFRHNNRAKLGVNDTERTARSDTWRGRQTAHLSNNS